MKQYDDERAPAGPAGWSLSRAKIVFLVSGRRGGGGGVFMFIIIIIARACSRGYTVRIIRRPRVT